MKTIPLPSFEELHSIFEYKDGVLYYKDDRGSNKTKGKAAGVFDGKGYVLVSINKRLYKAHRIIFKMIHGFDPDVIDHVDGNKSNNAIENLRNATKAQNGWNCKTKTENASGVKGVHWCNEKNKWIAKLRIDGARKYIGSFLCIDEAKSAIEQARLSYHQSFCNHGY